MANVAYIRTSTRDQKYDRQKEILSSIEMDKVFLEKVSGKDKNRAELQRMLDYIRDGDILYVESLSRLARNMRDLLDIVDELEVKGVSLISIKESFIDTTNASGKLIFNIFATLSEFEREVIKERQKEGIEIAKKQGKYKGRKKINITYDKKFEDNFIKWKNGEIKAVEFMRLLNLKKGTFYRRIREYEEKSDCTSD